MTQAASHSAGGGGATHDAPARVAPTTPSATPRAAWATRPAHEAPILHKLRELLAPREDDPAC